MKPTLPFLRALVGNPSAYALQHTDGVWTAVREELTDSTLREHLARKLTAGTYVNRGSTSRTLVFDIDDDDKQAAHRIREALLHHGVPRHNSAVEFSGRKGYHVWVVLADYVPAEQLRRLGRAVLADAEVECEVFPKQDATTDLGSLIKLPGGIHQVTGKPNDFVAALPAVLPIRVWNDAVVPRLPEAFRGRAAGTGITRFPCMEHIQSGIEEGGRNISMLQFATLARLGGLTGDALQAAMDSVNAGFSPPLDGGEVEKVFASSAFTGPVCDQLPADRHCGELCIRERAYGLKVIPGRLRNAPVGAHVVVEVGSRGADGIVFLNHDDLDSCVGKLNHGH